MTAYAKTVSITPAPAKAQKSLQDCALEIIEACSKKGIHFGNNPIMLLVNNLASADLPTYAFEKKLFEAWSIYTANSAKPTG